MVKSATESVNVAEGPIATDAEAASQHELASEVLSVEDSEECSDGAVEEEEEEEEEEDEDGEGEVTTEDLSKSRVAGDVEIENFEPNFGCGGFLSWDNICYSVKVRSKKLPTPGRVVERKRILSGVSGFCQRGQTLAILGPSGAGKSTLLEVLAMRRPRRHYKGSVCLDGSPLTKKSVRKRCNLSFVNQMDVFVPAVRVIEQLEATVELRVGNKLTKRERDERVQTTLDVLGLRGCAHTYIGGEMLKGISGGEKKRLSIAVELLTSPDLLLIDEPTSGLDAALAYETTRTIASLASRGHTVVISIHQPRYEIWQLFDWVMLLTEGRVGFFGPACVAQRYYETLQLPTPRHKNPAEHFLDLLRVSGVGGKDEQERQRARIDHVLDTYPKSKLHTRIHELQQRGEREAAASCALRATPKRSGYPSSFFLQFKTLFKRALLNQLRDRMLALNIMAQFIVIAIFVGLMYLRIDKPMDRFAALFYVQICLASFAMYGVVFYLPGERRIFNRERAAGSYRVSAYFFGTVLANFPVYFLGGIIFMLICYWMIGLQTGWVPTVEQFALALLCVFQWEAFGFMCSALAPTYLSAVFLGSSIMMLWFMTGGFFATNNRLPDWLGFLQYTSPFKYLMIAVSRIEFEGRKFACSSIPCPIPPVEMQYGNATFNLAALPWDCTLRCLYPDGESFLKERALDEFTVLEATLFGLLLLVVFRVLGYCFMRFVKVGGD